MKHCSKWLFAFVMLGIGSGNGEALASAFQLYEQDAASIGNYHAGIAAIAENASTSYYNPAGLVLIKNQEFVLGADPVNTNIHFDGTVGLTDNTIDFVAPPVPTSAQGGNFNVVPFGHFATPVTKNVFFGFSVVVPFGLKTDYGQTGNSQYAATLSELKVVDITPSLALAINNQFSVGLGVDVEHVTAELDQNVTVPEFPEEFTSKSINKGSSNGVGYHLGGLFQFSPRTRVGLVYHSEIHHNLKGTSSLIGPIANGATGGEQVSEDLKTSVTLPSETSLSLFHSINNRWDVMGSVTYTRWSVFNKVLLENVAGILALAPTNTLPVLINEDYRNTLNYSVGANFNVNERWILRTGLGFDESPANDRFRNLQLPDSNRVALAFGAHFQATKRIGFDAGWTHLFARNTSINNLSQVLGDETSTTNGPVTGSADVLGLQLKVDL